MPPISLLPPFIVCSDVDCLNAHGVDLFRGSFRCFAPLRRRKRSHLVMACVSVCSHIDISKSHKLDNEGDDEFIGREELKPGGLHLGVATY
nr:hypothetical protein [Tanacetum cinerariifolium]